MHISLALWADPCWSISDTNRKQKARRETQVEPRTSVPCIPCFHIPRKLAGVATSPLESGVCVSVDISRILVRSQGLFNNNPSNDKNDKNFDTCTCPCQCIDLPPSPTSPLLKAVSPNCPEHGRWIQSCSPLKSVNN